MSPFFEDASPVLPSVEGFAGTESDGAKPWRWALGPAQKIVIKPRFEEFRLNFSLSIPVKNAILMFSLNGKERLRMRGAGGAWQRGFLDFSAKDHSGSEAELNISVSHWNEGDSAFTEDPRPLAYCVHDFEISWRENLPQLLMPLNPTSCTR
jgi:hypothetical protein